MTPPTPAIVRRAEAESRAPNTTCARVDVAGAASCWKIVIAQNCVWLGNWEADDCDRQFVIRRIQARSWPGLGHHSEAMGSIAFGGHGCGTEQPSTPEPSQLSSHPERL